MEKDFDVYLIKKNPELIDTEQLLSSLVSLDFVSKFQAKDLQLHLKDFRSLENEHLKNLDEIVGRFLSARYCKEFLIPRTEEATRIVDEYEKLFSGEDAEQWLKTFYPQSKANHVFKKFGGVVSPNDIYWQVAEALERFGLSARFRIERKVFSQAELEKKLIVQLFLSPDLLFKEINFQKSRLKHLMHWQEAYPNVRWNSVFLGAEAVLRFIANNEQSLNTKNLGLLILRSEIAHVLRALYQFLIEIGNVREGERQTTIARLIGDMETENLKVITGPLVLESAPTQVFNDQDSLVSSSLWF